MKECPKCGRLYSDSVNSCPDCQVSLNPIPAVSDTQRRKYRKPLLLLGCIAVLVLVFFLGRISGGTRQAEQPEQLQTAPPATVTEASVTEAPVTEAPTAATQPPTTEASQPPVVWHVGQTITMGLYTQRGNGREPIEWQVLDVCGDQALIISKYCLDGAQYHETLTAVTWEDCDLRWWLNNFFLYDAFSSDEIAYIQDTCLSTPDSVYGNKSGGNDTVDKIFCLSIDEAETYFSSDSSRKAVLTEYASEQTNFSWWWLRSPGGADDAAKAIVNADGTVCTGGNWVTNNDSVRPAMWVKMH